MTAWLKVGVKHQAGAHENFKQNHAKRKDVRLLVGGRVHLAKNFRRCPHGIIGRRYDQWRVSIIVVTVVAYKLFHLTVAELGDFQDKMPVNQAVETGQSAVFFEWRGVVNIV